MSINNRLNQLYRRKADNIYNNSNLQIEMKYGTTKNRGGYENNTKYDLLEGGYNIPTKNIDQEKTRLEGLEQAKIEDEKDRVDIEKEREEYRKKLIEQKKMLTEHIKGVILDGLEPEDRKAFLKDVGMWERDPTGGDIVFGLRDAAIFSLPILKMLKKITSSLIPKPLAIIADIGFAVGDYFMEKDNARLKAFDMYRNLRTNKFIYSIVKGSKRGWGKNKKVELVKIKYTTGKRNKRAQLVREIMKEKGLNLPQASKYIKEINLQY